MSVSSRRTKAGFITSMFEIEYGQCGQVARELGMMSVPVDLGKVHGD
jgi:hypothetical protein